VPYFHVVFTLAHELSALVLQNKRLLYDLLFRTSAATLLEVARDPKHLGADIGLLCVLHTWGQNLQHHPPVHCVVPAWRPRGRWLAASTHFFLPVRVLSCVFRGKFTAGLKQLFLQHKLQVHGSLQELAKPERFHQFMQQIFAREWVVYAKPPFGGAEHVLHYLARYTHRVAISNHRLVDYKDGRVSFRWKDYACDGKQKVMTVSADEFLRRFLIHVLPRGLVRIRHFGLFANRRRAASLLRCRALLGTTASLQEPVPSSHTRCPVCSGDMLIIKRMQAHSFTSVQLSSCPTNQGADSTAPDLLLIYLTSTNVHHRDVLAHKDVVRPLEHDDSRMRPFSRPASTASCRTSPKLRFSMPGSRSLRRRATGSHPSKSRSSHRIRRVSGFLQTALSHCPGQ
jgi:putative transposase